ncbi:MAG: hypothetical protein H6718_24240 [Polyangiaceae bacterium]|nr:hypothetical protein [Myxococcales bacterium]MCB9588541.1 hypothetical protein [Polyangiaceae bacterium]
MKSATDLTNRRSLSTPSKLMGLIAMFALVGSAGCAMEAQPEEEGVTQSSALVEDQGQQVDDVEFDEAESMGNEAEPTTGTVSDDPTPVPWHEDTATNADPTDDAEQVGTATDPTPQPWDVHVLNNRYSAQSQQSK